ncbi:hypothetical protein [Microbispora sp. H10836]|uniref:hypothetical protein n=1 Tax=Microbispora sp. H10836 TaxID=2729106 RepID=UPI0014748F3E|nr:hypothetical protein [Microbispora sp. H10836]
MLKVDTGRLREPAAWMMLAVVITGILVSIARLLIGSSPSSTFGVRAAMSLHSLVSPLSTALAAGAVLLVAKAGAPTPRARLVSLGAAGSLGLGVVFGVIGMLGVLVGDLLTFRDRFEYLITGLPMIALAVFGALFASSTAAALQSAAEPAGDYFGRREDAHPPLSYAPALPQGPHGPQGHHGPLGQQAPQGYGEAPGAGAQPHAPTVGAMPVQQGPGQQGPGQQGLAQQQFGHPAPGDPQNGPLPGQNGPLPGQNGPQGAPHIASHAAPSHAAPSHAAAPGGQQGGPGQGHQNGHQNGAQTPPQNLPHPGQYDALHQGQPQNQPQSHPQNQPQGTAYGQSEPAQPQLPPAEHRYAEPQQYAEQYPQEQYGQEQYGQEQYGQERGQGAFGQERPQDVYGQEHEPQHSYAPAPTAPQPPPFGQPGAPVHGQGQAQQPRPSLQDVQTGAHYADYGAQGYQQERPPTGAYGTQPEAPAPQRSDYSPPQGPVFDQYGYAGQQTDSGSFGQFPAVSAGASNAGYDQPSYDQPSYDQPSYDSPKQDQPYGQGSPFSGYSGPAFARQAGEHAATGPAFDAPPAYEGPADPREQQLAQAYQQAQSYQKIALPDHPTGPQDLPEYYDNPLGHPQSEPAPFQPPAAGPTEQTVRFDPSAYHGDPLSDPLRREEPLDPTAIYTPDRSQAKYEEGSAPDQAGRGTDPNLPWYGSER